MDFQVVRFKYEKQTFEVLVKPEKVPKYREGKFSLQNTIFSDQVFIDHKKGDKASENDLKWAFPELSSNEILEKIIKEGDYQLSTKERKEAVDEKRKEIINYIHKYYIDPKTKKPHPIVRIENALNDVKFTVDLHKSAETQVNEIFSKLLDHIFLKKSGMTGTIKFGHEYIGSCLILVKNHCTVERENYDSKGIILSVSILPGEYEYLLKELNVKTKGNFSFDIDGEPTMSTTDEDDKKKKSKQKQKKK
jgi:ribosome maturation protein SDO1